MKAQDTQVAEELANIIRNEPNLSMWSHQNVNVFLGAYPELITSKMIKSKY